MQQVSDVEAPPGRRPVVRPDMLRCHKLYFARVWEQEHHIKHTCTGAASCKTGVPSIPSRFAPHFTLFHAKSSCIVKLVTALFAWLSAKQPTPARFNLHTVECMLPRERRLASACKRPNNALNSGI
jgi:hypothetical protein